MPIKVLSTVGPATDQKKSISKLLKFGDILRTNGSHNTIKWHEKISILIKSVNSEAIHLFDIPGIKPRTKNSANITIKLNEKVCFYYNKNFSHKSKIKRIELTKPLPSLTNKEKFFSLSDGQFIFEVINFKKNYIVGQSKSNFELYPHKGLNIPGAIYDNNLQLDHYKKFLKKSKNVKFDVIGLSYIQSKKVINNIRKKYNDKIIVAKIENLTGLNNVSEIVEASDVIMIDRGDLAAEVGNHNLFEAIIKITNETKKHGKPLIMGTENLVSMVKKNEPTKSEIVSLGLNFLLDSDYIMLSEETAISANWYNTIKWLNNFQMNSNKINYNITYIKDNETDNLNLNKNTPTSIWSTFKFNLEDSFVFISRTGASIKEFKKRYTANKSFVFTDSIKTRNLCKFWKEIKPMYFKSITKFNNGKNIIKEIKKNKDIIFDSDTKKIICLFILNPRKGSRANCIYILDKSDIQ